MSKASFILTLTLLVTAIFRCAAQQNDPKNDPYVIVTQKMTVWEFCNTYNTDTATFYELNTSKRNFAINKGDTIYVLKIDNLFDPKNKKKKEPAEDEDDFLYELNYEGKRYFICKANPKNYRIDIHNLLENGRGVYDFNRLAGMKKNKLLFAMNGGMYKDDLTALGLLISNSKVQENVNTNVEGKGNFYELQPNGIFFMDKNNKAYVVPTSYYVSANVSAKFQPRIATQSGPMMVINGQYNSNFNANSHNLKIRNGVGVDKDNNVYLVISEDPVNFHEFSKLFKMELGCDNALYLDGVISQMYVPAIQERPRMGPPLGPIITVVRQENASVGKQKKKEKPQ